MTISPGRCSRDMERAKEPGLCASRSQRITPKDWVGVGERARNVLRNTTLTSSKSDVQPRKKQTSISSTKSGPDGYTTRHKWHTASHFTHQRKLHLPLELLKRSPWTVTRRSDHSK